MVIYFPCEFWAWVWFPELYTLKEWHMTEISVVRRWRQEDQMFKIILNYIVSSKAVWDIGGHFRRKTEAVCGRFVGEL